LITREPSTKRAEVIDRTKIDYLKVPESSGRNIRPEAFLGMMGCGESDPLRPAESG